MSRIDTLLLYALFASSLLVEVRLPIVGFSACNLAVPVAAVALAWRERASIAGVIRAYPRLLAAALAVYAWAWVSAVNGELPALSTWYVAKYTGHLVVFVALLAFLRRRAAVAPAQRAAYHVLVVLAVLGVVEYVAPEWGLFTFFRPSPGRYPRVTSVLISPNQFGVLTAVAVAFGAALAHARAIRALVHAAALPVLLLALALCGSRNGWLVFAVLVLVLTAAHVLALRAATAMVAGLALLLLTFPVPTTQLGLDGVPGLPLTELLRAAPPPPLVGMNTPAETLQPRTALWKAAIAEIQRHPVSGIGLEVFANTIGPRITQQHWINTHNLFLNVATELGLVGLALFLVFLAELVRCGDPWCWTTSIPLLGIGVGQLFDCFIYDHAFMTFAVFFAACYASVPRAPD